MYVIILFAHTLDRSGISSPSQSAWKIFILCLAQWLKGHLFREAPQRVR